MTKAFIDAGLLTLRVSLGAFLLFGHGLPKLMSFNDLFHTFPDPLGVGSEMSYLLAVGAEFLCSLFLVFGLFTRIVVIPLIIMMTVAAFVVHGDDPWSKKEFALLYALPFLAILLTGPGKYAADQILWGKRNK